MNEPPLPMQPGEPYIPLRIPDLVDLLMDEAGTPDYPALPLELRADFEQLAEALGHRVHAGFHNILTTLKDVYAPFDPDADTVRLGEVTQEDEVTQLEQLFRTFQVLLERAGFHQMTRAEIETTMQGASYWGIEMSVCWDVFDQVEVFYRGAGSGWRARRPWWKFFRLEEVEVPTFKRVVIILKQKPHKRLGNNPDTSNVFLKLFKDIPQMDIEMLLPGTQVTMPKFERGKLGFSVISSFLYAAYKLASTVSLGALLSGSLFALLSPITLLLGYGYKTIYSFQVSRRTYMLQLTQSLYYQGLDTNAGVLHRLFDDASEQETRGVLLVYYFLWRFAGTTGWTREELENAIEADIQKRINQRIELRPEDALARLVRLKILRVLGERYLAQSPREAMKFLESNRLPAGERQSTWRGYVPPERPRQPFHK
jgi:Protein of unknown function (DUF3754)